MLSTVGIVVLVLIFVLAAALVALPRLLGRRGGHTPAAELDVEPDAAVSARPPVTAPPTAAPRLRDRLGKTRAVFSGLAGTLKARGRLDDGAWDELEETLLLADVGVPTTTQLLDALRARASERGVHDADRLPEMLESEIAGHLNGATNRGLCFEPERVNVWLLVGVNGVGKTTTAAKLAQREQGAGHHVVLAAADTFRAAAGEQLAHWAERVGSELVRGQEGADPGAVVFDAMEAARARGAELVIADTAGRLHTKVNLMEELAKVRRVVERTPGALQEVLLVLDASTGQNGLAQARQFTESVGVTGVVLTKLDGTAKGGIVLAIEADLGVPVKLVGIGESAADLVEFDPVEFAAALLA